MKHTAGRTVSKKSNESPMTLETKRRSVSAARERSEVFSNFSTPNPFLIVQMRLWRKLGPLYRCYGWPEEMSLEWKGFDDEE